MTDSKLTDRLNQELETLNNGLEGLDNLEAQFNGAATPSIKAALINQGAKISSDLIKGLEVLAADISKSLKL